MKWTGRPWLVYAQKHPCRLPRVSKVTLPYGNYV